MTKQKQPHNRTVAEVLEYAARCVEFGHAQRVLARNALGRPVIARGDDAICWCAIGGIVRATEDDDLRSMAREALKRAIGGPDIADWNDTHTQSEVVSALRAAAKAAR